MNHSDAFWTASLNGCVYITLSVGEEELWTTQGSCCHFSQGHDWAQALVWLLGIQGHSKGKWILIVMLCRPTTDFLSHISL